MNKKTLSVLAFTAALGFSGAAGAGLIDRGGGLIYDDVLDITWLADANLFKTQYDTDNTIVDQIIAAVPTITHTGTLTFPSPYSITVNDFNTTSGLMTWFGAMAWAEWLNFGGYDDWRLPTTLQPDPSCGFQFNPGGGFPLQGSGYNCTGSQMGHMFYNNLGGNQFESVLNQTGDTDQEKANLALFDNVQSSVYWSGAEYAPNTNVAWFFLAFSASRATTLRTTTTTHGPCAPAMSPPPRLPSRNRVVLRWSG